MKTLEHKTEYLMSILGDYFFGYNMSNLGDNKYGILLDIQTVPKKSKYFEKIKQSLEHKDFYQVESYLNTKGITFVFNNTDWSQDTYLGNVIEIPFKNMCDEFHKEVEKQFNFYMDDNIKMIYDKFLLNQKMEDMKAFKAENF